MRCLTFNREECRGDPPRNWRVYDFTLYEKLPRSTWTLLREGLPTNSNWQFPGQEAFCL